ncbi:hypothetical protein ACKLNR_012897 [Fusarium oxysporum f. sp. zingiberi]
MKLNLATVACVLLGFASALPGDEGRGHEKKKNCEKYDDNEWKCKKYHYCEWVPKYECVKKEHKYDSYGSEYGNDWKVCYAREKKKCNKHKCDWKPVKHEGECKNKKKHHDY